MVPDVQAWGDSKIAGKLSLKLKVKLTLRWGTATIT